MGEVLALREDEEFVLVCLAFAELALRRRFPFDGIVLLLLCQVFFNLLL